MWMGGGGGLSPKRKIERPFEFHPNFARYWRLYRAQRAIWAVFKDDGGGRSVLPAAVRGEVCRGRGGSHWHSGGRLPHRLRDRAFFFFHAARVRAQTPADRQCTRSDAGQS